MCVYYGSARPLLARSWIRLGCGENGILYPPSAKQHPKWPHFIDFICQFLDFVMAQKIRHFGNILSLVLTQQRR